jgi:hypothetical protein
MKSILLALFVAATSAGMAQDTINLITGKQLVVKDIMFDDPKLNFSGSFRRSKLVSKPGFIDYYRTYSVVSATGVETVLYTQDSTVGNYRTPTEMRYFVAGEQHANTRYKPYWALALAGGVSLGASLFDTWVFKDITDQFGNVTTPAGMFRTEPSVLQVIIPFVVTAAVGLPKVRLRLSKMRVTDRAMANDENFIAGYARIARQKKVFAALEGSLIGVGVGILSYFVFRP